MGNEQGGGISPPGDPQEGGLYIAGSDPGRFSREHSLNSSPDPVPSIIQVNPSAPSRQATGNSVQDELRRVEEELRLLGLGQPVTGGNDWLNDVIRCLWDYASSAVQREVLKNQEALARMIPFASSVKIHAFHLGNQPPHIGEIDVKRSDGQLKIFVPICYKVGVDVQVDIGFRTGIEGVEVEGTLVILMAPLLDEFPILGAVHFLFSIL
jgi:hypothetical protein